MVLMRAVLDAAFAARRRAGGAPRGTRTAGVFAVPTGGCEGCAVEWLSLAGSAWGLEGTGLLRVEAPQDADVLLVMGALTRTMAPVLERAWHAMAGPRALVAVGDCAIDGGLFGESYAMLGGLEGRAVADARIPGCPPAPAAIRAALMQLVG